MVAVSTGSVFHHSDHEETQAESKNDAPPNIDRQRRRKDSHQIESVNNSDGGADAANEDTVSSAGDLMAVDNGVTKE